MGLITTAKSVGKGLGQKTTSWAKPKGKKKKK